MKKLYYSAFTYLILALMSGLAFREITKILDVFDTNALGKVHGHLFSLGFMMFVIFLIMEKCFEISKAKKFNLFFILYHVGLIISTSFMLVRGIVTVLEIKGSLQLSNGLDAAISGMSGIGHIILSIALVLFMLTLKRQIFTDKV